MARRLWHVSSSLNRASIAEHGLNWRRGITTVITRMPIRPHRLRLMHADRRPGSRELSTASLVFRSARLTVEEMSALAGIAPDDAGYETGEPIDDLDETPPYSWWLIAGGDRYAPLRPQVEELVARIAAAEAGLTRLAAEADEAAFDGDVRAAACAARGCRGGRSPTTRAVRRRSRGRAG